MKHHSVMRPTLVHQFLRWAPRRPQVLHGATAVASYLTAAYGLIAGPPMTSLEREDRIAARARIFLDQADLTGRPLGMWGSPADRGQARTDGVYEGTDRR